MSGLISFNEVLEKLNIKEDELFDLINEGLQPYDRFEKPIPCPPNVHEAFAKKELISAWTENI